MSTHRAPRRRWWRRSPADVAGLIDAKRRRAEADALADSLEAFRVGNNFGQKFHLTFAPKEQHR